MLIPNTIHYFWLTGYRYHTFADIVFLYDDSGSIGRDPANFVLMKNGRDRMVVGFITTYAIVPITTNVVSSNPT
jgi:hypothetical protein